MHHMQARSQSNIVYKYACSMYAYIKFAVTVHKYEKLIFWDSVFLIQPRLPKDPCCLLAHGLKQ